MSWDPRTLPSQQGKTVVVTGAGRGVGYFVSEQLAAAGARVILTTRDNKQRAFAAAALLKEVPTAKLEYVTLDLSSLESIRSAATELAGFGPIDVLINNAGLTAPPRTRQTTLDGLELVVGSNAFGPFALTALLFDSLAPTARVIGLGSLATRLSKAEIDDLQSLKKYSASQAYATSKHAVHAFAFELDRRLRASDSRITSLLAHPGFALDGSAPRRAGVNDRGPGAQRALEVAIRPMAHGKDRGAWPVVRAAIDPDARGGEFYGPSRSVTGKPVVAKAVAQSMDPAFGAEFWRQAEQATGIEFRV